MIHARMNTMTAKTVHQSTNTAWNMPMGAENNIILVSRTVCRRFRSGPQTKPVHLKSRKRKYNNKNKTKSESFTTSTEILSLGFGQNTPKLQQSFLQYVCLLADSRKARPADILQTFIYLLIGLCVNLSVATSQQGTGSFETQAWGWGFAVMIGIYLGGGVSGSHLSPTISISLSIFRGFSWKMAIVYICMQLLAGLSAGAVAYA
jgi:hypothetical protein